MRLRLLALAAIIASVAILLLIGSPSLDQYSNDEWDGTDGSYSEGVDPGDGGSLSDEFDDFEFCVLELLDPAPSCTDFDNPGDCNPRLYLTDGEVLTQCWLPDPFLTEEEVSEEEQAKREKIQKIRAVLENVVQAKSSGKSLAETVVPGRYADGEQDALRHMVGAAILYNATPGFAKFTVKPALTAREDTSTPAGDMDVTNNTIGIGLATSVDEDEDWLCGVVFAALQNIKNGTAKVINSDAGQKAKVDYWLEHPDELRALLGCPQVEDDTDPPMPEPEPEPEPMPEPMPEPDPEPMPEPESTP